MDTEELGGIARHAHAEKQCPAMLVELDAAVAFFLKRDEKPARVRAQVDAKYSKTEDHPMDEKPQILPPEAAPTSVKFHTGGKPLVDYSKMASEDLDAVIVKSYRKVSHYAAMSRGELGDILLPALMEMEGRYDKKQGVRNDLLALRNL